MAHKYTTRCWLCGSTDLEPDDRGIRCRSCGATYNIILRPGPSPITIENDPNSPNYHPKQPSDSSPSVAVRRRAAKARSDAS